MQIKDIGPTSRNVSLVAKVVRKGQPYQISTRYGPAIICDAAVEDETGKIGWRLWREQIDMVQIGDIVRIENAFVRSFQDWKELNLGRDGRITVLQRGADTRSEAFIKELGQSNPVKAGEQRP